MKTSNLLLGDRGTMIVDSLVEHNEAYIGYNTVTKVLSANIMSTEIHDSHHTRICREVTEWGDYKRARLGIDRYALL
jgi:hypothetical protein